jgi:molecular chaperone HtpG
MENKAKSADKFQYKAEINQLLDLIIHSLYTHPEVFLRELISNASDALNKARFRMLTEKENTLEPDIPLEIRIETNPDKGEFSLEDTGIGMTKQDLINNIGTVAHSGTLQFLKEMKEKGQPIDETLIGQFGLGFYSVFMVTDKVFIETLFSEKGSSGYLWESEGKGSFTIKESQRQTRGTKIYFKLKETSKEFAGEEKVKAIINKYSNFADFPIFLNGNKVNKVTALWDKKKDEISAKEYTEFYKFISNDFDEPLGYLHLSLEGSVNFKSIIFIPKKAPMDLLRLQNEKSIHLYSEKILIQDDCKELLPEYLRFVKGVVDTRDLPLNVSREVAQSSQAMAKINSVLTKKILSFLQGWADKEPEKYKEFYLNFGPLFKTGVSTDFTNREKIIELLRFESSLTKPGELTSLKDYLAGMDKDQKEIYYIAGNTRQTLEKNPNLEYFNKNKIEVLFLTEPVDVFILPSLGEYNKKPVKSIEKANIDLKPQDKIETPQDNLDKSLISVFKDCLKDKVQDVVISKRLVDSPVTLVSGKDSLDPQMERMMKLMNKDFTKQKKILEVNTNHPLVRNLSKMYMLDSKNPFLEECILQLYGEAQFIEGELNDPADFVKRMNKIMEKATQA